MKLKTRRQGRKQNQGPKNDKVFEKPSWEGTTKRSRDDRRWRSRIARKDTKLTVEGKGGTCNGRKPACSTKIARLTGGMINNREAEGTGQRRSLYNRTNRSVAGQARPSAA